MSRILKAFLIFIGVLACFFGVTFAVYMFNLDMKLTSRIEPFLLKHYDNMPRNTFL